MPYFLCPFFSKPVWNVLTESRYLTPSISLQEKLIIQFSVHTENYYKITSSVHTDYIHVRLHATTRRPIVKAARKESLAWFGGPVFCGTDCGKRCHRFSSGPCRIHHTYSWLQKIFTVSLLLLKRCLIIGVRGKLLLALYTSLQLETSYCIPIFAFIITPTYAHPRCLEYSE